MALFEGSDEEKTESATAFRREEFRKMGSVALSRELISLGIFLATLGVLYFSIQGVFREFGNLVQKFFDFSRVMDITKQEVLSLRSGVGLSFFIMVGPVFVGVILVSLILCAAQVGLYFTWEPLMPKWERLNPISGFQRLLSSKGAIEAVKSLVKMAVVGWVVWKFAIAQAGTVGLLVSKSPGEEIILVLRLLGKMGLYLVGSYLIFAVADFGFQKYSLEKQMRMTRREVKEEFKLREGDPLIKSRIKGIQKKIASRRMMEDVPKSSVVVTNPTHLAIALLYEEGMSAPKVVAKGAGFIADKIRSLARENGVPLVENKPLARTLFKNIKIGHPIPKELYKAVAEVLAYVFKLKGSRL
jgi:flagellar biosynthetic protein FlhB